MSETDRLGSCGFLQDLPVFRAGTDAECASLVMKRIWAWLSEHLFTSAEPVSAKRPVLKLDTPDAPWSLSQVEELRWA